MRVLNAILFSIGMIWVSPTQAQNAGVRCLSNMVESIENMKSFSGEMIGHERVDGEIQLAHSRMIIQFQPRKLYAQTILEDGSKGAEILYRTGENDNKVLISPDGFPYVNVSLSPFSSFMRNGRHNTILEAGGTYLGQVIGTMLNSLDSVSLGNSIRFDSIIQFNEKPCYQVTILNEDYGYKSYTMQEGESLRDVALKHNLSEYKLVECNENIDGFNDGSDGDVIRIPTSYAKRTILYLDTNHFMPWYMANYDDVGLYSSYEYKQIEVNPVITDQTFNPENPAYGF